ncbi:MAG TPA: monovalent cation/H(+) antiporter subunit G [Acetobacteraceae bacterium]|nr:monovalent cation/H(+) antiporter subunit G [Acetobacteraceae bacterium]
MSVAVPALLAFAAMIEVLCCLGIAFMRDAFDRLHYLGPAIIFPPCAIAAAIAVQDGLLTQAGIKAIVSAATFLITSPILSYATARAIATRRFGELRQIPIDEYQGE